MQRPSSRYCRVNAPPSRAVAFGTRLSCGRSAAHVVERLLKVDGRIRLADEAHAAWVGLALAVPAGDYHRQVRETALDFGGQLLAADAGQAEVGQQQLEAVAPVQQFEGLLAAADGRDQASQALEHLDGGHAQ